MNAWLIGVGALSTILVICFIAVWALTEFRRALVYLAVVIGAVAVSAGVAFFWTWVGGAL